MQIKKQTPEVLINNRLKERLENNSFRSLKGASGKIDFSSNDYLGLAKKETKSTGGLRGSTGSRLLTGNSLLAEETEKEIADFHGGEAALTFSSGYLANLGLLSSLGDRNDTIIYDEYVHASMRDGIRLSPSRSFSFRHNDTKDLKGKLKKATGNIFIAIESLYSMDGDFAPGREILELSEKSGASVIIDEAHTGGIYGETGHGLYTDHPSILARIYTYGKAFGYHGATVVCSNALRNYLINFSKPFIYSTGLSECYYLELQECYKEIREAGENRKKLFSNIEYFITHFPKGNNSPVQSIICPGNKEVKHLADFLLKNNMDVKPILSPTVPAGTERLRISLHSYNSTQEIDALAELINKVNHA